MPIKPPPRPDDFAPRIEPAPLGSPDEPNAVRGLKDPDPENMLEVINPEDFRYGPHGPVVDSGPQDIAYHPRSLRQAQAPSGDVRPPPATSVVAQAGDYYASLATARAPLAQELANDPQVRADLFSRVYHEVGNEPAVSQHWFMEEVFNRALSRGQTLSQAVWDPGYYPSRGRMSGVPGADYQEQLAAVVAGSNVSNLSTGNASLGVGVGIPTGQPTRGGERFGREYRDLPWVRGMEANLGQPGQGPQVAQGPKPGSHEFWAQGKVETQVAVHQGTPGTTTQPGAGATKPQPPAQGAPQVARRYEREAPPADAKPRSEPPAQVADAGPRPGTEAYWRGPKHGEDAAEATRVADARRSRGHATGEPGAQSQLPYAGSAMPSGGDSAPAPSVASVAYEGGGIVPAKIVINIAVARI